VITRSSLDKLFKENYNKTLMSFQNDMEKIEEEYDKQKVFYLLQEGIQFNQ